MKKYNLLKHPNLALTPDGKGKPYSHDGLDGLPDDVLFDPSRPEDFVLLDGDEFAEMLLNPDMVPDEEMEPELIDFEIMEE